MVQVAARETAGAPGQAGIQQLIAADVGGDQLLDSGLAGGARCLTGGDLHH